MHCSIKYINRNDPQVDSTIPPLDSLSDTVVPTDAVYFISGWKTQNFVTESDIGKEIGLYFPMVINGALSNSSFRIKIDRKI